MLSIQGITTHLPLFGRLSSARSINLPLPATSIDTFVRFASTIDKPTMSGLPVTIPRTIEPGQTVLIPHRRIIRRIGTMARTIDRTLANEGLQPVIALPVMNGGMLFAAELIKQMNTPISYFPVRASSYNFDKPTGRMELDIASLKDFHYDGQTVLLMDDILDSGKTLKALTDALHETHGVPYEKIKIVVLQRNNILPGQTRFIDADFVGFETPRSLWTCGFGMNAADGTRNQRSIVITSKNA